MRERLPEAGPPAEAIPELRYLRGLVTGLAVVMALGIAAIVILLWLRLPGGPPLPQLPARIILPPGAQVEALTFARDWIVVVTTGGSVLLYERGGRLAGEVTPR